MDSIRSSARRPRPLAPQSPLRFESGTIGQPLRLDLPARHFRVVGIRCLSRCLVGTKLRKSHENPRAGERSGHLGLRHARRGDAVARFKIRNNAFGRVQRAGECGSGIDLGMGQDHTAIRVVPAALEGRHRGIGGPGPARVDVPDVGLGDRVRRLQYVAPVWKRRGGIEQIRRCLK